jgi:MoaD family protein
MRVKLEFITWLSELFGHTGKFIFEQEINEGFTLYDLLIFLSSKYENFAKYIFNPNNQKFVEEIILLINDKLPPNGLATKLNNGDKITFIPPISGG